LIYLAITLDIPASSSILDYEGTEWTPEGEEDDSNGVAVGVGVGLPLFVIAVVVGFLVYKRRKAASLNREQLSHTTDAPTI